MLVPLLWFGADPEPPLAVTAPDSAGARRENADGRALPTDRGSQFRSRKFVQALDRPRTAGSTGRVGAAGDNAARGSFQAA